MADLTLYNEPEDAEAVRQILEAAYARCNDIYRKKDDQRFWQLTTPDFTQQLLDGQTLDRSRAEPLLRQSFAAMESVSHYAATIDDLTVNEDEAVALTTATLSMRAKDPFGASHDNVLTTTCRHFWTKTDRGWLIRRSEELKGRALVDGQVVMDQQQYQP
jgi:ketosteroid isomerase-like protein